MTFLKKPYSTLLTKKVATSSKSFFEEKKQKNFELQKREKNFLSFSFEEKLKKLTKREKHFQMFSENVQMINIDLCLRYSLNNRWRDGIDYHQMIISTMLRVGSTCHVNDSRRDWSRFGEINKLEVRTVGSH